MTCDGCPPVYTCPKCRAVFNKAASFDAHWDVMHGSRVALSIEDYGYRCEDCGQAFWRASEYVAHRKQHEKEGTMDEQHAGTYCPDCDKWIFTNFVEHREQEHPPSERKLTVSGIDTAERFGYES